MRLEPCACAPRRGRLMYVTAHRIAQIVLVTTLVVSSAPAEAGVRGRSLGDERAAAVEVPYVALARRTPRRNGHPRRPPRPSRPSGGRERPPRRDGRPT